jgi:hypothetical protein
MQRQPYNALIREYQRFNPVHNLSDDRDRLRQFTETGVCDIHDESWGSLQFESRVLERLRGLHEDTYGIGQYFG